MTITRKWNAKCGPWNEECSLNSFPECDVWSVECGVWNVECGMKIRNQFPEGGIWLMCDAIEVLSLGCCSRNVDQYPSRQMCVRIVSIFPTDKPAMHRNPLSDKCGMCKNPLSATWNVPKALSGQHGI